MSRAQFFVIGSAVIFVVERVLPALTSWPVFIFPVFVILFMLTSKNDARDLTLVASSSIVFDLFSGSSFGSFTLIMLAVCLMIYLFKNWIKVEPDSFFTLAIYTAVFTFSYFAILSVKIGSWLIPQTASVIVVETLIFFAFFVLVSKLANAEFRKI